MEKHADDALMHVSFAHLIDLLFISLSSKCSALYI